MWFGGLSGTQAYRKHRHLIEHIRLYSTLIETMRLSFMHSVLNKGYIAVFAEKRLPW